MSNATRQKVICDTNIWYNIAEGTIDPNDHKDVDLIATGVNILEFASTENFQKNFELVKRAVKAMETYHAEIIEYDPWYYLLTFHTNVAFDASKIREIFIDNLTQFQGLVDNEFDDLFQDDLKVHDLIARIQKWNQPELDLVDEMNAGLVTQRQKGLQQHGTHGAYKKDLRSNKYSFVDIMRLVNDILAIKSKVDPDELRHLIDWDNIELLIHAWDSHFKDKILQRNAKFELNDLFDVLNMAYVSSSDLYWTAESKWQRCIANNPFIEKYLYKPNV